MWRSLGWFVVLAGTLTGCILGDASEHAGAAGCGAMARSAPHRPGVTTVPGFHGDMGRLLAGLRRRDVRIQIPARWSATWSNAPSLGPAMARGEHVPGGSVVKLVLPGRPWGGRASWTDRTGCRRSSG